MTPSSKHEQLAHSRQRVDAISSQRLRLEKRAQLRQLRWIILQVQGTARHSTTSNASRWTKVAHPSFEPALRLRVKNAK